MDIETALKIEGTKGEKHILQPSWNTAGSQRKAEVTA